MTLGTALSHSSTLVVIGIEPYLEPNDKWAKSAEARELLNTLELECSKSEWPSPMMFVTQLRALS